MEDQPPNLDEVDELDGYWTEQTTITVSRYTKARLDKQRDGQHWDQYLEKLRSAHADPLTFTDVEQIAEYLAGELEEIAESASMASEPTFGDEQVKEILNRIDDLQSQLPKDVAKEVSQR